MEDDWDLYAVVRGCAAVTTTAVSSGAAVHQGCNFPRPCLEDPFEPRRVDFLQELTDLCIPFFPKPPNPSSQTVLCPQSLPISPLSVLQDLPSEQTANKLPIQTGPMQKQQPFSVTSGSRTNPTSRSKRRKNHLKTVCHVAAENLSSDMWSWRKYGQKPIKGSPYPRGYYRCSTSKGCLARKQVERNRSDPEMFIITYTAEHNHPVPTHRNSLAGGTRQKAGVDEPTGTRSPAPEKVESSREGLAGAEDDDDDNFSPPNAALEDDFFAGLEDLVAGTGAGCGDSHFPAAVLFPWSAATAAGGGG